MKRTLWLYAFLVVFVTGVSWGIYEFRGDFLRRPLFGADNRFHDLTDYISKTAHLYHGSAALGRGEHVFNYPAPGAFVFHFVTRTIPGHPVLPYLIFLPLCILGFGFVAWRASGAKGAMAGAAGAAILVTVALGCPLWYDAYGGNIEGVVWAFSGAGLCFFLRGRYRAAALLIGLAASVKPFPILFLLLFLRFRRYKEAGLGVVTAGAVIVVALIAIGPNPWKAYKDLQPGLSLYVHNYVENLRPVDEERFDHSLLDGMKSIALSVEMGGIRPHKAMRDVPILRAEPGGWHVTRTLAHLYPIVVIVGLGLLFAVFYRAPLLNQMTAIAVAITMFPPSSGEYTLLQLYVPFGALLVFLTREVAAGNATLRYTSMLAFAVLYALLFTPLTFLWIYAGDAKLLLLCGLLVMAARSPMRCAYFGDAPDVSHGVVA